MVDANSNDVAGMAQGRVIDAIDIVCDKIPRIRHHYKLATDIEKLLVDQITHTVGITQTSRVSLTNLSISGNLMRRKKNHCSIHAKIYSAC